MKQLGDILLEGGLVSPDALHEAYAEHQREGRALGRVLVERGVLTESQLVAALAEQIGMPFVDLGDYAVDGAAVAAVPASVCRRYNALPIGFEDGKLLVAMSDPANVFAIDDIRSISGLDVRPMVATLCTTSSGESVTPSGSAPSASQPSQRAARRSDAGRLPPIQIGSRC